jgi:hypothetical protein
MMRVITGDCDLINEFCSQTLNGPSRCKIVWVASNRHCTASHLDKRCEGSTRLQGVAATAKSRGNLKANMTCTELNVLGFSDSEIDVPYISAVRV